MPLYEYLCRDCNAVYQFFSRTVSPKAPPPCPKARGHRELERQLSGFAIGSASPSSPADAGGPPDDPATMARMEGVLSRMEGIDENDPKAMGRLMREMSEITGERDPAMDEAIRRLEGGEDPERIEELLDSHLGQDETENAGGFGSAPRMDSGLYEM